MLVCISKAKTKFCKLGTWGLGIERNLPDTRHICYFLQAKGYVERFSSVEMLHEVDEWSHTMDEETVCTRNLRPIRMQFIFLTITVTFACCFFVEVQQRLITWF